jgi:hypothetical protein
MSEPQVLQVFHAVLGAQLLYVALGAGYNLVSLARRAHGKPLLAPTDPGSGLAFMAALLVPIAVGRAGYPVVFAVLWLLLGSVILKAGVIPHAEALRAGGDALEHYASRRSCQLALAINSFGIATIASGLLLVLV